MAERPGPPLIDRTAAQTIDAAVGFLIRNNASEAAAALRAFYLPKWSPNTAYAPAEPVINPSGQVVTANAAFTSGATYNAADWTISAGGTGSGGAATAVSSVAGRTGAVTLTTDDLTDATTVGKNLAKASSAATARTAIGAGTSSFSGVYTDLSGRPTIPAATTDASALTSGTLDLARVPAGVTLTVVKSGSTWPARPTSRTDVVVAWKGADPSPAIVASGTGGMLDNVDYRLVTP